MISWVVGRGGLLGRGVEQSLKANGAVWHPDHRFAWEEPNLLHHQLAQACKAFASKAAGAPWQIAWCAGAGVVASGSSGLEQETLALRHFLASVAKWLCGPQGSPGAIFLASSAGGLYAGSGTAPYCETSTVAPLSPYGWSKLEQESLARDWSRETGIPLFIGRISNLYGPGQDLAKGQGLITQVCLRVLARQPLTLYVPLDTIRDYIFVTDASRLVANGLDRLRLEASRANGCPPTLKILSSQQPVTVATVLAQFRWITKRPVSVIIGASPSVQRQPRDLRMISKVWPELDQRPVTTLSEGIARVFTNMLELTGRGQRFASERW